VDIRKLPTGIKGINYLLKYMVKNEGTLKVDGHIYGMSDMLRNMPKFQDVVTYELSELISKSLAKDTIRIIKGDFFTLIYFLKGYENSLLDYYLRQKMYKFHIQILDLLYHTPILLKNIKAKPKPVQHPAPDILVLGLSFDVCIDNYFV
jgi:hypothetical protein